jgi:hypothetical protein
MILVGLLALVPAGAARGDPQGVVPNDRTHSVDALREDLRTLWAVLEEGHGGLERYVPRETLNGSFDQAAAQLTRPLTELEFYRVILPLIAGIKDGHTRARLSNAGQAELCARPVFLPVELRFVDGKAHLFRNLSARGDIEAGAEVVGVNETAMPVILPTLLSLVPSDAGILSRRLRLLENPHTFGELFAVAFGQAESFRLRIRGHGGGSTTLEVPGVRGEDLDRIRRQRYPETAARRPLYDLTYHAASAVLTIRGFGDDRSAGSRPYPEFLRQAFRELDEKEIRRLVIDLRGNGGGRDEYGRLLFAHFMAAPFQYYRSLEVKKDHLDLLRYARGASLGRLGNGLRRNARGWYDVTNHPNVGTMRPEAPRYSGRTAILLDGLSFSTTGETTSLFHYHRKALFLGEECGAGYYGNTSGAMAEAALPRTGIRVTIPLVRYTLAVDGYPRDRGIIPDIQVAPTIQDLLDGRDTVMERALEWLADRSSSTP